NRGAVGNLVALALAAVVVENDAFARTGNGHALAPGIGHVAQADGEADAARGLGFDRAGHGGARSGPPDVEGAHGQLRARLADGLGGNHAHRLAAVDQIAAAQIAPVAMGAQAVARFAGQRRTHLDLVDAYAVDV